MPGYLAYVVCTGMYVCVCVSWMYVGMDVYVPMYGGMEGWSDGRLDVWTYER